MAIGQSTCLARRILEVLRPLTGRGASGVLAASALAGDVLIPKGSYAAPVVTSAAPTSQLRRDQLYITRADAVVPAAGGDVPVRSVLGGLRQNLPAGTVLRWDPPLANLAQSATVKAPGVTGGADPAVGALGAVRRIVEYEQVGAASAAADLFAAKAGDTPAIVLAWDSAGAPVVVARGVAVMPERWVAFVVVGRGHETEERRDAGRDIRDALIALLHDRASVGRLVFSQPPIRILGASRLTVGSTSYVYQVSFETHGAIQRLDTRGTDEAEFDELDWNEWKRLRIDVRTATVPPLPVISNAVYGIPGPGFDDGFSAGFGA